MDPYKRLKIEFNGIKDVIFEYTSDGDITNFLNQLETSIEEVDGENIVYCLERIDDWYKSNIYAIHTNTFVHNLASHDRNMNVVSELLKELKEYDFSKIEVSVDPIKSKPKIFLSHCSANKKYGDALEHLLSTMGIKTDQLIYTSHPLHKIPLGVNIYEYLRENMGQTVFVIILWSNEYLDSPACLNEMGAAWVAQTDYTNIFVPDFAFGNPKYYQCAVDTRKMGAVLNGDAHCKANMIELRDKIAQMFDLNIDEQKWTFMLDCFIEEITN